MRGIDWIKITTNMFEDEKMRLFDAMEERDTIHYMWIRLLLQAGKVNDNGLIYLKEDVPYTKEMLSVLFNRPLPLVEKVLGILEAFKMIKIYENGIIKICNWEKHQNIEGMKRVRESTKERVKKYRAKKKIENKVSHENNDCEAKDETSNDEGKASNLNVSQVCNANVTHKKERREEENKNQKKNLEEERVFSMSSGKLEINGLKLIKYLKDTKVNIKGLTLEWILDALSIHEEKYIKMAMDIAIKRNKRDTNYISGILKNWLEEGYPKTYEEMEFGSQKEKPKLRFNNFEPREYDYEELEKQLLGWKP